MGEAGMSRDFIGSVQGRDFLKSLNRDRVARLPAGALVAREIVAYWLVFTGGVFGRLNPDPSLWGRRYFKRADFSFATVFATPTAFGTQAWNLGNTRYDAIPSTIPILGTRTGQGVPNTGIGPLFENGTTDYLTETGGRLFRADKINNFLQWDLADEFHLSEKYEELRGLLDNFPFPPALSESESYAGVGSLDTLRTYKPDGSFFGPENIPNIDARGAIAGWDNVLHDQPAVGLFAAEGFAGYRPFVQWVGIHLRDVRIGGASKVWQFANAPGRIDLGLNDFSNNNAVSFHTVVSETSCDVISTGAILEAPEFLTIIPGFGTYPSQSRIAFPAHKWTVPSFVGRLAAFSGIPPSCAPEIVGTSP